MLSQERPSPITKVNRGAMFVVIPLPHTLLPLMLSLDRFHKERGSSGADAPRRAGS